MSTIARTCTTLEAAHRAANEAYQLCRRLLEEGKRVHIEAREAEDQRSVQQNAFYWGVVLREVAQQVVLEGTRYTPEAWHILFKQQHLGYSVKRVQLPGRKRKSQMRELRSTTGLSVRAMTKFLDAVQAQAVTELGVRFSCPDWREYRHE